MLAKIIKSGETLAISLPSEAIEALDIKAGIDVQVIFDETSRQLVVMFADQPFAAGIDKEFARQVSEFIAEYRPALEALAK